MQHCGTDCKLKLLVIHKGSYILVYQKECMVSYGKVLLNEVAGPCSSSHNCRSLPDSLPISPGNRKFTHVLKLKSLDYCTF